MKYHPYVEIALAIILLLTVVADASAKGNAPSQPRSRVQTVTVDATVRPNGDQNGHGNGFCYRWSEDNLGNQYGQNPCAGDPRSDTIRVRQTDAVDIAVPSHSHSVYFPILTKDS